MIRRSMALAFTYASNTFPTELPSILTASKVALIPCSARWLTRAVPDSCSAGVIEYHRQFVGEFLRTHQDRPARFEYQPLDKLIRSVIVWRDREDRQILEPRTYCNIRGDVCCGKPAKLLLVADGKARGRRVERLQQATRVRYAAHGLDRRRIIQVIRDRHLRPDWNVLFNR